MNNRYTAPKKYVFDNFEMLIFDYFSDKFRIEFRKEYGDKIHDSKVYNDTEDTQFKKHMLEKYGIEIQGLDSEFHFSYAIADEGLATWFKLEQGFKYA